MRGGCDLMMPAGWDAVAQCVIAISGVVGLYGALHWKGKGHIAAVVVALCGQPMWLSVTFGNAQYGMFVLSCVYTGIWLQALWEALRAQGYLPDQFTGGRDG
jgi:hypothetical protein